MKKYFSHLKFISIAFYCTLLLTGSGSSVANQDQTKIKRVVFGEDSQVSAKIRGKVTGSVPGNPKLYGFLIRTNSQISRELQALIAPNYQVPVEQGRFAIPFAQSGLYMVGVFADKVQNGLLDLFDDPYWFAQNMPVRLSSAKTFEFNISVGNRTWPQISLINFPEDHSLLFQISSIKGSPFILLPMESNPFEVRGLTKPFGFSVIVDRNENEIVDPAEQTRNVFWVPRTPQTKFEVEFGKVWNPLTIDFPRGNAGLELRIQNISTDQTSNNSIKIPILPKSEKSVTLAHLNLGEYQLFLRPKDSNEEIKGPYFVQERNSVWEVELSEDYLARFKLPLNIKVKESRLQFFMNGTPTYNCEPDEIVKLYQPGEYEVALYSDANNIEGLHPLKIWDRIHATARFDLQSNSQNATVNLSDTNPRVTITGTYNWMHNPASEAHLHIFQETNLKGYYNRILSHKTSGTESATLALELNIDSNRNLYFYLDLAGDAKLDEVEPEYVQVINPQLLQLEANEFQLPIISNGILNLDITGSSPEKYFLEIVRADIQETIAASFLNAGINTYANLPIGYPLHLNIIHDINANQELDSQDRELPTIPVNIHLFEQKLTLPINLESF